MAVSSRLGIVGEIVQVGGTVAGTGVFVASVKETVVGEDEGEATIVVGGGRGVASWELPA